MRRGLMGGLLGFSLAALAIGTVDEARGQKPAGWLNSYAAGRQTARKTGKPIFLAFR